MVQRGGSLGFTLETSERLGIPRKYLWQKFQGDKTAKLEILRLVDFAHAAATDRFPDSVVGDRPARSQQWSCRLFRGYILPQHLQGGDFQKVHALVVTQQGLNLPPKTFIVGTGFGQEFGPGLRRQC